MQKKRSTRGDEALGRILELLSIEQEELELSQNELIEQVKDRLPRFIPISILSDRRVGALEAVVVYLKDQCNLTYHEIAQLLNRDDRTIWTTYQKGSKKRKLVS